ncbi:MAG: dipeptidase [Mycobacteriales bacterium]
MTAIIADAVRRMLPQVLTDLKDLVAIPSVSADPMHLSDVRRSADKTAELFRQSGFDDVRIVREGAGMPAVIARRPAPDGRPTVLLYAHHDVQPTGDVAAWTSPPFEATERGERLFGRGIADDKAGIAAHLAAVRAHGDDLPVGVTVFVEGEEEVGSPTIETVLATHRDLLRADVIVIADSGNWDIGRPSLTTTLRGLADCTVEVRTLDHAVHSGMFGGAAPDALTSLCRLLATLHHDNGDVAVQGISTATAAELDYPVDRFRAESGLLDGVDIIGTGSIVEQTWARPAVSVLAIDSTRVADASNTLIPSARAKVSLRVPPGQDAHQALARLTEHLQSHAPWGARVSVSDGDVGGAYAIDASGPAYDAFRAACEQAWGVPCIDIGVGGSIPFIAVFAELFPAASILVTGIEDPDTRAHGIDEGLHLGEFEKVCLAEALLLDKLGG